MTSSEPTVFQSPAELFQLLQAEFLKLASKADPQLVCLATGSTFADFYQDLDEASPCLTAPFAFTHLDEYIGFGEGTPGGMAWELMQHLPALGRLKQEDRFFPFPHSEQQLAAHGERIESLGGVALQLLGIGRNGHLAFNEPGSDPSSTFSSVPLHPWTIADMGTRFAPAPAPTQALTSGMADILGARRILLVARGSSKAEAVRRMLREPVSDKCPASHLRTHANVSFLLDREACALL